MHLLGLSTGCVLVALCSAHDVYIGNTTIDCTSDDHACQTSGTAMLDPGETFIMTTHADHDVKYVSVGYLEANEDKHGVVPTLKNVNDVNQFAVDTVQCDLEFFSVVWFCPTHKDVVMARNGTYEMHVPKFAQRSQFIAWGHNESPELVLGLSVQLDAARARHKVGGASPAVALTLGSVVTLGVWFWAWLYYYGHKHGENAVEKSRQEMNAWTVNVVALASHVWYVTIPLNRAASATEVPLKSVRNVWQYYSWDVFALLGVVVFTLVPTFDTTSSSSSKQAIPWACCSKRFVGVFFAASAVALYAVTGLVHGRQWLWITTASVYATFLVGVSLYLWLASSRASHVTRIQQYQCLFLLAVSLLSMFGTPNRMFFAFSSMQWFLLIMVLQVLSVQVGAIDVEGVPVAVLWSAVFVSTWALLFLDVTSYGVAALLLAWASKVAAIG